MSLCLFFFFFKQKTAYEMRISDWSSDVCSSDLLVGLGATDPLPHLSATGRVELTDPVIDGPVRQPGRVRPVARRQGVVQRVDVSRCESVVRSRVHLAGGAGQGRHDHERLTRAGPGDEGRSAERRVGKECVGTVRSGVSPLAYKTNSR